MKIEINGEEKLIDSPQTIFSLIQGMGMKPDRVAVELNREIVPREQWARTALSGGDRLEIVHFVGGGNQFSSNRPLNFACPFWLLF